MASPSLFATVLREPWADCENQASDDAEKPIKFLQRGPGCKRATQGLYLCPVVNLERAIPASPCFLAHKGCSVSDKYGTMMSDTVSPAADSPYFNSPCVSLPLCFGAAGDFRALCLNPREHR